ncbi:hypothetical protein ACGFJ7_45470 [Actinoplanes sp. NPDC048988]|uniref:hypothetical protein n=1 Tax=Actinoplanes sp. NPDC048988 TaxID=3363901 RepID=UPI00371D5D6C
MRVLPLTVAALQIAALTGCDAGPENVSGDAGPAGAPAPVSAVSVSVAPTSGPATSTPTVRASSTRSSTAPKTAPETAPETAPATTTKTAPSTGIRATDWNNVTLKGFPTLGDLTFKNGKASSGANNCTMLPGGARPFYAEYLAEEPASAPVTEDALILVDCGSDMRQQSLVPVKLGYDQKTRETVGAIKADAPTDWDEAMTFTSYRVENGTIVTTVRKTDGTPETRRYRFNGGTNWERF